MKLTDKIKILISATGIASLTTAILLDKYPSPALGLCLAVQTGLIIFQLRILNKAKKLHE